MKIASEISGYNKQYIRRLFRQGVLKTIQFGQFKFIKKKVFEDYLKIAGRPKDKRAQIINKSVS